MWSRKKDFQATALYFFWWLIDDYDWFFWMEKKKHNVSSLKYDHD